MNPDRFVSPGAEKISMIENKLAIQWASNRRSIAVQKASPAEICSRSYDTGVSVSLAEAWQEVMNEAGIEPGEVTRIVVSRGPGSYTGIRIALSVIQGFSISSGNPSLKIVAVESQDAVADIVKRRGGIPGKNPDSRYIGYYAQRKEFLVWKVGEEGSKISISSPHLVAVKDFIADLESSEGIVMGSDLEKWIPEDYSCEITISAEDLLDMEGRTYLSDQLHLVEPYYVRPQEFVRAQPARFRSV